MEVNLNIGSHLFRLDTKLVLMVSKKYEVKTTSDDFDEELEIDVLHTSFNILFYSGIQLKFYQEIPKDSIMLHNKTIDLLYNDILSIMNNIPINTKEYSDVRLTIQEV
jgi:hypothetical protein